MRRLIFVFALTVAPALAQQTGITGRLTDPSNAVMTNVVITASAEDGTKFATQTNGQGMYQIPAVRAGKYVLRFEIPGFVPAERTLTVLVGQVATVDVALQLASASTTVAVEAAAGYLEAQVVLVVAAREAHGAGLAVTELHTSWLDTPAEEAVIQARVEADQ